MKRPQMLSKTHPTRHNGRLFPGSQQWQKVLAKVGCDAINIGVLVAAIVVFSSTAWGQSKGRKVIRLEAIKVEGRIQKPQAFYILQRSNLNFEGLELKKSFLPKIVESVDKKPF